MIFSRCARCRFLKPRNMSRRGPISTTGCARCGRPVRVGSGSLQHDGGFNICWVESLRLFRPNCLDQYAYVVKQTIGGTTTTIYDGLAAGAWFAAGDEPVLTTYSPQAFKVDQTGEGDGDAFVFLDLIGDTESHELTTPTSTGWDRVAAPTATSGLLFPNPGVQGHLRNLGGGVELTFIFKSRHARPSDRRPVLSGQHLKRGGCKRQSDRLALLLWRRTGLGKGSRRGHSPPKSPVEPSRSAARTTSIGFPTATRHGSDPCAIMR